MIKILIWARAVAKDRLLRAMVDRAGKPCAEYSFIPIEQIPLATLKPSRFIVQSHPPLLPYRDHTGAVNVHLVRASLRQLTDGHVKVAAESEAKLRRWLRHAERHEAQQELVSITHRPDEGSSTVGAAEDEDARVEGCRRSCESDDEPPPAANLTSAALRPVGDGVGVGSGAEGRPSPHPAVLDHMETPLVPREISFDSEARRAPDTSVARTAGDTADGMAQTLAGHAGPGAEVERPSAAGSMGSEGGEGTCLSMGSEGGEDSAREAKRKAPCCGIPPNCPVCRGESKTLGGWGQPTPEEPYPQYRYRCKATACGHEWHQVSCVNGVPHVDTHTPRVHAHAHAHPTCTCTCTPHGCTRSHHTFTFTPHGCTHMRTARARVHVRVHACAHLMPTLMPMSHAHEPCP